MVNIYIDSSVEQEQGVRHQNTTLSEIRLNKHCYFTLLYKLLAMTAGSNY